MRIANLAGRAVLLSDDGALDVESASAGSFGPDPSSIYDAWDEFVEWARGADLSSSVSFDSRDLDAAVPAPSQVFAIGVNYRDHAKESNLDEPSEPVVFTKFVSSLAGPNAEVQLTSETVDYETELVVVIAREAHHIDEARAWDHIAGFCVGQDISDRGVQLRGPAPQFSLGKSYPGFGPLGPAVVTIDELTDPNSLWVRATIESSDGTTRTVQNGSTKDLIFSVASIISKLSQVVTLRPGDVIFTGTPAGVGAARGRFLAEGDVLMSEIEGLGALRNRFRR
jgi:2-keto-4-pentenoate hydratase/2-oxohepta-3-ene-1,7-dioic acid hydratase in catechol pathway